MPTHRAYAQALQVLQYLVYTRTSSYAFCKIDQYQPDDKILINLYTDASYNQFLSQGGFYMEVNGCYAGSKSYRLKYNIGSSYDAEVLAVREGLSYAKALQANLLDFGFQDVQIKIFCDNLSVVNTVQRISSGGKLLDRVYSNCIYSLRYDFHSGIYDIEHIQGLLNPADLFTKALGGERFAMLLQSEIIASTFKWKTVN